ncbi:succinate--CoA ligase subunit alpha [Bosea sp. BK604]|uniref:succinate--CoA ligase subunit alpha n=1 Tax=Bosea sp. BK604 TaxID=2512180 RepID=UPI001052F62F|nr:succinate--CoA ligase subunit alpha [Bosea sp. BK604]TCR63155.1 succinyl-CoA synthetase alpha subunit [Bosea sp. BK604]
MAIIVDERSRILIQGITGPTGRSYARRMVANGTPLVGGVAPGRQGQVVEGVPVFDNVADAVAATGADAALSAVRSSLAMGAALEALAAGIGTLVVYTENVPLHDAIRMRAYARARGARLLGPNSAGVISPGKANLADLNDANLRPGRVGIVSKSGTLTYEVVDDIQARGFGESSVVCLGGDPVIGTSYADVLPLFEADPQTDLVILIGEPGGRMEHDAIEVIGRMSKPVIAYIAAQNAPPEKRMGHAGAIYDRGDTTAAAKLAAFRAAGCEAVGRVTEVAAAVERVLSRAAA